jgi:hypothetical protein
MKTELEVRRELKAIRAYLERLRADSELANGASHGMAYGAQQALTWMLGTGMAPSEFEEMYRAVKAKLEKRGWTVTP